MTFESLGLSATLVKAVAAEGYSTPTPIQVQAIPFVLQGRDVLGCAQTGTGKTAAFALPTIQRLAAKPAPVKGAVRCLVITPTRELATQVSESFGTYGRGSGLRHAVIFGGVGQGEQVSSLRRGVEVLVATPGRLLDLMKQGHVSLKHVEVLVLDEADRMLDMGFINDIRKILAVLPKEGRQTLFFSATMPPEIQSLVSSILKNPARVEVTPVSSTAEKVEQKLYYVERGDKGALLVDLLKDPAVKRALVFTRTKNGANRVAKRLSASGVRSDVIHGNKSQNARERALDAFKRGEIRVLVATDIAARGLDVDDVSHVVNFELPNIPETYVHRIGRTARAGSTGIALSLCDHEERAYLKDIERTIKQSVPVVEAHPHKSSVPMNARPATPAPRQQHGGGQRRGGGGGGGGGGGRPQQRRGGRHGGGGSDRSSSGHRASSSSSGSSGGASQSAPAASGNRNGRTPMPKWS